ncbi:MAG: hypothetical protein WC069_04275 [Candidatus Shapirobacteria bacterium]
MKLIIILVLFLIVTPFIFFQYFLNSGPRDLGVKYTSQNYTDAHQKMGVEVSKIESATSPKDSLVYTGKKEINISLDSAEITAYLNAENWQYAPLSNIQIKVNSDGTAQATGVINLNNVLPFISMTTPVDEVNKAIAKFKITNNPPFYASGKVTVTNNQVMFNVNSLEIGKIPVPANYVSENLNSLNKFATDRLNAVPNLSVRSLTLADGKANLDATVPEKVLKLVK